MKNVALMLVLLPLLAAAAPVKKNPADTPSELEGKWVVTEATTNGIENKQFVGTTFVIKGDQYSVPKPAGGGKGRIQVDGNASPKRIQFEVVRPDGKVEENKGRWIYELKGDELRMASLLEKGGSLPEKIVSTEPNIMFWKLNRVKD